MKKNIKNCEVYCKKLTTKLILCLLFLVLMLVSCQKSEQEYDSISNQEPKDEKESAVQLSAISVTSINKGAYHVGDTITGDDITVTATYTDGTSKPVTTWITKGTVSATDREILVSYTENEITKIAYFPIRIAAVDNFTDAVVTLRNYEGTAGSDKKYVEFGYWPQTVKPDYVNIDTNRKIEKGLFTYYAGSDGNWYVKQEEYGSSIREYERDIDGNLHLKGEKPTLYSDGTEVSIPSEKSSQYFKVEPIVWRVLEEKDGKMFLLAEKALKAGLAYYDNEDDREIGTEIIYPSNYMHSRIRAYLNGYKYQKDNADCTDFENKGFLQTAFTSEAQAKIATTTVDNSFDPYYLMPHRLDCDDTSDKVFLLSVKEATTESYGFSAEGDMIDPCRFRKPTGFALATGAYGGGDSAKWWLRTPVASDTVQTIGGGGVYADGVINYYPDVVNNASIAIVPALWVTP